MKEKTFEHYFTEKPISKPKLGIIKAYLRGYYFEFLTASGLFSYKKIDYGSRLLIEKMIIKPTDYVLDMGCGYGVIGIVASRFAKKVVMVDINKRAVWCAKHNIRRNNIKNAVVKRGNLYEPVKGEKFDVILSNLPMSAGLDVVYKIIEGAREHLRDGGSLQVVVRKGHERVKKKMEEVFGNAEYLAKSGGYRVIISYKRGEAM